MRSVLIQIGLFLLPFALYVLYLVMKKESPFTGQAWRPLELTVLALVGLFLSVGLFTLGWQHSGEQISGRNQLPPVTAPAPAPR